MNNKYWGRINDLLRDHFEFKGEVDIDFDGDPICISSKVNGKKTQGLVGIYKRVRYNYEAELSGLVINNKTAAIKEINARNHRLERIISEAELHLAFELTVQVHRRLVPEMQGDQLVEIEKTDPPCQLKKINTLRNYIDFAKDILRINERELVNLNGQQNNSIGFSSPVKESILKQQYTLLKTKKFIQCEFEVFKNVFLGQASDKINWKQSLASLAYFIKGIPDSGRFDHEIWVMTVKCFTNKGKEIVPDQLSHARDLKRKKFKKLLDDVVNELFPRSHPGNF